MEGAHFLISVSEKEAIKAKIRDYLSGQTEIRFAYLGGSFLEGGAFRDIDLGIYFEPVLSKSVQLDLALQYAAELSCRIGFPVDIQPLNNASLEFQYQTSRGELLFSQDEEQRLNFIEDIWPQYFDFQYFMQENLRDLLR